MLREPGKINAEHFLESYLGATIDYKDIFYEEGSPALAGAAVFNSGYVRVFDRERMCIGQVYEKENTVLIDNSTMEPGREGFALFTHLHEGGHLMIHPDVYRIDRNQISIFADEEYYQQEMAARAVTCKRCSIESRQRKKLVTDEDFREHQANTCAATLAMPRPTFIPYAKALLQDMGYENGVYTEYGRHTSGDVERLMYVVMRLADSYGVSKMAARVQLERQHLLHYDDTLMRLDDYDFSFGLSDEYD